MSDQQLKDLCKKCDIKCPKCLDTGKLWKGRDSPFAHFDGRGSFDVIRCNNCSNGNWLYCSHSSNLSEFGIKLFHKDDNNISNRISIVNNIIILLQSKEKEANDKLEREKLEKLERERLEQEACFLIRQNEEKEKEQKREQEQKRIKQEQEQKEQDEQRKREQERKRIEQEQADESYKISLIQRKRERIERAMNDNNPQPIWGQSLENSFSTTTTNLHLNVELGKLIEKTTNAIQAYGGDLISLANTIKDIKIDLDYSSKDEKTEQTKCSQSTTSDGFPIYLFLTISTSKENTNCKLLEWCGFITSETKITIKYMILFPQNNTAKKICDISVTNITDSKLTHFVNDMLR